MKGNKEIKCKRNKRGKNIRQNNKKRNAKNILKEQD